MRGKVVFLGRRRESHSHTTQCSCWDWRPTAKWLHAINHDKRPIQLKSPEEQFMNGERISLTFRHIGTFLSGDGSRIYGQGAKGKTSEDARSVVNGTEETASLLEAFGKENQQSEFNWDAVYGEGFDVLHFTPRVA
ncbi:hypothetical protein J3R83DRAFT_9212 [Lanmaoa asiatica]|nr:hypothetical protein J3R83DRAFT_9212 [Lanmaoa asiatica]